MRVVAVQDAYLRGVLSVAAQYGQFSQPTTHPHAASAALAYQSPLPPPPPPPPLASYHAPIDGGPAAVLTPSASLLFANAAAAARTQHGALAPCDGGGGFGAPPGFYPPPQAFEGAGLGRGVAGGPLLGGGLALAGPPAAPMATTMTSSLRYDEGRFTTEMPIASGAVAGLFSSAPCQ